MMCRWHPRVLSPPTLPLRLLARVFVARIQTDVLHRHIRRPLAMPPHETQGSGTSPMQCRPSKVTTIRQPGDGARGIAADDVFRRRVSSYRPPLRRSYVAVLACLDSYCRAPRHNCSPRTAVLAMRRSRIRRSRRPAGQIYFCTRLLRLHQQFSDSFCVAALRRYHGTAQRSPAAAPSLSSSGC